MKRRNRKGRKYEKKEIVALKKYVCVCVMFKSSNLRWRDKRIKIVRI